jgi:hypothetical protein
MCRNLISLLPIREEQTTGVTTGNIAATTLGATHCGTGQHLMPLVSQQFVGSPHHCLGWWPACKVAQLVNKSTSACARLQAHARCLPGNARAVGYGTSIVMHSCSLRRTRVQAYTSHKRALHTSASGCHLGQQTNLQSHMQGHQPAVLHAVCAHTWSLSEMMRTRTPRLCAASSASAISSHVIVNTHTSSELRALPRNCRNLHDLAKGCSASGDRGPAL